MLQNNPNHPLLSQNHQTNDPKTNLLSQDIHPQENHQLSTLTITTINPSYSKPLRQLLPINLSLCLSGFYFGYVAVFLGALNIDVLIGYFHMSTDQSLSSGILNGVMSIGGGLGCLLASGFIKWFSRKNCILVTGYMALIAGGVVFIPNEIVLILGRLVQGMCLGLYCTIVPMYIRQFSPNNYSGLFGVMFQTGMAIGTVFSFLFAYILSKALSDPDMQKIWFIVFGFPSITVVIQVLLINLLYPFETPKYLILNKKEKQAKHLLKKIYEEQYVDIVYQKLTLQYMEQGEKISNDKQKNTRKSPKMAIITAFFMSFTQQMIGVGAVCIYGGQVVGQVLPSLKGLVGFIINAPLVLGTFVLKYLLTKYPCKRILQVGMLSLCVVHLIIGIGFGQYESQESSDPLSQNSHKVNAWAYIILLGEFLFSIIYTSSVGSMLWVYMPAIIQPNLLPYSSFMNWVSSAIVLIAFPTIKSSLLNDNPMWLFIFFAIYTFVAFLIYSQIVIEIRGKDERQIWLQYKKISDDNCEQEELRDQ